MLPKLDDAAVELLDFSLVHDSKIRPTAHELYIFVTGGVDVVGDDQSLRKACHWSNDTKTEPGVDSKDEEIKHLQQLLAEKGEELAAKDASNKEKEDKLQRQSKKLETEEQRLKEMAEMLAEVKGELVALKETSPPKSSRSSSFAGFSNSFISNKKPSSRRIEPSPPSEHKSDSGGGGC